MGKLSNDELEMVYKTGIKPSDYLWPINYHRFND